MKPYVVTGAAGFIGSRIVAALNQRGISEIIAVDNLEKSAPLRYLAGSRVRDYLHHREFMERFDGNYEAVFHQGACTDTMLHDRALMMKSNFEFTKELFARCQAARTPLI